MGRSGTVPAWSKLPTLFDPKHRRKQEHISPACWEQVAEIVDQGRKRQLCENAKSALCNNRSSGQPLRDCILQHQAELKAVCGGSLEKVFN